MKYIIFDTVKGVLNFPVIFPEIVSHSVVGEAFGGETNIVSAGYADHQSCCGVKIVPRKTHSRVYPNKPPTEIDGEILTRAVENY